jgi:hypothetical protein
MKQYMEKFDLPGATVVITHSIKTVWIYDLDPGADDSRYEQFEAFMRRKGYFVQVIITSLSASTMPGGQ